MPRHRGKYNPENCEPYEISRSRVENFVKCPACFYMKQVEGISFPSMPGFLLNEATDVLLKKYFDRYRISQKTPPFLADRGCDHFIPFQHENFDLWTQSMHYGAKGRMHTVVEDLNLKVGGGLDDVWFNGNTRQLHIVDYKSTSQKAPDRQINLEGPYKEAYKRQMDLYIWVLRRMGFDVSDLGYFLYVDGDRFTDTDFIQGDSALMEFKCSLIEYETDQSWINDTLVQIRRTLDQPCRPSHSDDCEYGAFLSEALQTE